MATRRQSGKRGSRGQEVRQLAILNALASLDAVVLSRDAHDARRYANRYLFVMDHLLHEVMRELEHHGISLDDEYVAVAEAIMSMGRAVCPEEWSEK